MVGFSGHENSHHSNALLQVVTSAERRRQNMVAMRFMGYTHQ